MKERVVESARTILAGLLLAGCIGLLIWIMGEAREVREHVQQKGLQSVVSDVWCGKDGCKTTCGKGETP